MRRKFQQELEVEDTPFGTLKFLVVGNYYPGCPAQVSGPPERCYPEEPPEVEILDLFLIGMSPVQWKTDVGWLLNKRVIPAEKFDDLHDRLLEQLSSSWDDPQVDRPEEDGR